MSRKIGKDGVSCGCDECIAIGAMPGVTEAMAALATNFVPIEQASANLWHEIVKVRTDAWWAGHACGDEGVRG